MDHGAPVTTSRLSRLLVKQANTSKLPSVWRSMYSESDIRSHENPWYYVFITSVETTGFLKAMVLNFVSV